MADIQEIAGIERRGAERMRDALLRALPQMEEGDPGPPERWVLSAPVLSRAVSPTPDDLAVPGRAEAMLRRAGDSICAGRISSLSDRLQATLAPSVRTRLAPDIEALLAADGVAWRPGPREIVAEPVLNALRQAILAGVRIECDHMNAGSGKLSWNVELGPIVLLMAEGRQYLLAWHDCSADLRLFRLANLRRVDLLDELYVLPASFDLQAWLAGSFGIWREDPMSVEWRFAPEVAAVMRNWQFHPTQEMTKEKDGARPSASPPAASTRCAITCSAGATRCGSSPRRGCARPGGLASRPPGERLRADQEARGR